MKRKNSGKVLTAFNLLLLATGLKATTYYVSPNGSDNASGTSTTTPWKSISKINSMNLPPGTSVLFEGGAVFSGTITLDQNDANDPSNLVTVSSYGTGKATINSGSAAGFDAYNTKGFKVSNLKFIGSGMNSNTAHGVYIHTDLTGNVKLNKIELKTLDISNYGITGVTLIATKGNTGYKDVLMDGLHVYNVRENGIVTRGFTMQSHTGWSHQNVTIKNTEVHDVPGYSDGSSHRGSGIIFGQVDNGLIEKSYAHHNGAGNTHCGGPGGIWAWDCNNITIQYSESAFNSSGTGCDGLGFDLDGGVTNSVMQYNYSHDNDGAGYLLGQYDYARPWSNNIVRYNISENDGRTNAGGIAIFKGPGTTMNGVKIYNNTIHTSPSSGNSNVGAFKFVEWNTGITGIEVYNNIFQSTGGATLIYVPTGYDATFAGNLYWSSGATFKMYYHGTFYNSMSSWRNVSGYEMNGSSPIGVNANPNLLNAGNGGTMYPSPVTQLNAYKISSTSPANDAGLNLMGLYGINPGPHDFFNNPLLTGIAGDIGAHESVQAVTTGVSENTVKAKEIGFYPNPLKSGDPLSFSGVQFPYAVEIVSMTGATVFKQTQISTYSIPDLILASGMYLVSVVDDTGKKKINKLMVD